MRAVLLAAVLLLALPAAARAQDVDAAVAALASGYVYVDPAAEAAGEIDAAALERAIRDSGESVFVAVLPASAAEGTTPDDDACRRCMTRRGIKGTYALVIGREFRAGSDDGSLDAPAKATAALRDHPSDIQAALVDFVGRLDDGGGVRVGSGCRDRAVRR